MSGAIVAWFGRLAGCAILVAGPAPALAQEFPNRAIRLIVPYTPSGPTDILSRVVAQKLGETWGQPVVVENRSGAAGMIGTEAAARAAADGYTLCTAGLTFTTAAALNPKLAFSPLRDFTPVVLMAAAANVLSAHPSLPASSVKELIALAKSRPGQLLFPTGGVGGGQWLAGELFMNLTGTKLVPVPYRGSAPSLAALLSGEVSVGFTDTLITLPHAQAGRLRALAVTGEKRSAVAPGLPTMMEAGLPGYSMTAWFGLVAPAGTPGAVVDRLNVEVLRILELPDVRQKLLALGADPGTLTAHQFGAFLKAEAEKWTRLIRSAAPAAN